jgi:hypothetical protein
VALSARFEVQNVSIYDEPVDGAMQGINPTSDLGTAAEIACDGNRRDALLMAMANHDADARQKLAALSAVEKSDAGGEWARAGIFGAAPARAAMLIDQISTGYETPGRRTITVQYAMEQPEATTAVVRYLHRVEADCAAGTARIDFQAGLDASGAYRIGGFTALAPVAAAESPLIAGVCKGDWSTTTPVTGIGSWVGTHAFAVP